ncbi:hypothetical protein [uncultured Dysosmobacter sp.]|uniref:hypothetical protein n=1 Tax=uncultured Dysosmobacter sp. TaxID=2591384 RepID=UPI0026055AB9|nr:hypothetical protein [uncultured Dysosmobacter sp.]
MARAAKNGGEGHHHLYDGKAIIIEAAGKEHLVDAGTIVQAVGFAANSALYNELNETLTIPIWDVGDSTHSSSILNTNIVLPSVQFC